MTKRYVVSFSFTAEFEKENCHEAISSAAFAVKYGVDNPGSLRIEIAAELPVESAPMNELPEAEVLPPPKVKAYDPGDIPF